MTKKKKHPADDGPRREEQSAAQAPAGENLAAERDDLFARLQRVSADYLNYQKRVQREIAEARDFANADLIRELLGVLDDMERALEAARENHHADDPLLAGMQLVYDKALEVLARHGVTPIEAEGQPFDPNRHEAMMQQPADVDAPTVVGELQRGYELKGRLIRPARVIVGMPEPDAAADADDPPADE